MSILETINSSADVKKLGREELNTLCEELRSFEIESIARTGGHLASNLGTVELTVALHRVYDTAKDRLIFDVGHQCYTHKILTGRRDSFHTLRQFGGISGFPSRMKRWTMPLLPDTHPRLFRLHLEWREQGPFKKGTMMSLQ